MEELINGLVEKVGLDKDTAVKVIEFLKQNTDKLPELMGSMKDKIPGGLGKLL